jgi:hypothetical protein
MLNMLGIIFEDLSPGDLHIQRGLNHGMLFTGWQVLSCLRMAAIGCINTRRLSGIGVRKSICRIRFFSGWWFGTFFVFPYIGNNDPN